jgi:hypothetical protein
MAGAAVPALPVPQFNHPSFSVRCSSVLCRRMAQPYRLAARLGDGLRPCRLGRSRRPALLGFDVLMQ